MSIRANQDVFAKCVSEVYFKHKLYHFGKGYYLKKKNTIRECFKRAYYKKYFKEFDKCPFDIALRLTDSKILSGQGARLFQRAMGLTEDNIFGKNSIKACNNNPDMEKFRVERIKRFKRLSKCKFFCSGWFKRTRKLEEYIAKQ